MIDGIREVLVLTPALDGADGISEVSRQCIEALNELDEGVAIALWALEGGLPAGRSIGRATFRSAKGSRTRLAAWALARAGSSADDLLVVVLHVHLAPLALPLEMRGAQLACFLHGIEAWRRLRARERQALGRAAVLLAVSHWTAARFKQANPEYAAVDVRVCHLGVPAAGTADLPEGDGFALIVGRLAADERYKGHDALIDVWPQVRRAVPTASLMIVGDGDDRGRLETRVSARGLSDAIRFAGRVSTARLEGLYRASAFFALPSAGEGFGLAYLEAMRAGKACIASPGAAAEVVEDGVTGVIVDAADREALAAAIIRLFQEPDTCAAMGQAGRARLQAEFDARHFASRLLGELPKAQVHA